MKIITVIGARPQFIKAAVVSRAIKEFNEHNSSQRLEELIVHTGQHFDKNMSEIFFEQMHIPRPDYQLNINGLSHGAMTGRMLEKIEIILKGQMPDLVMVYGDTNSTLAGALAAIKLGIPVAHVEAGLRSHNFNMPEEINRRVVDQISKWLFCPTEVAVNNLRNEGFFSSTYHSIHNVGDVMYDAALYYTSLETISDKEMEKPFILATMHRAENVDNVDNMSSIFKALNLIGERYKIILPLHPRTKKQISRLNIDIRNIHIIEPVGYIEMLGLIKNTSLVITDSGGLQKEAYFFKKPCVVLRNETEWTELIEHGSTVLAGTSFQGIIDAVDVICSREHDFSLSLYGDGTAGNKIVKLLTGW